ncbi:MAG: biosynthetic peptidoglycan transglycosylase [Polyangiaceae bacterium]
MRTRTKRLLIAGSALLILVLVVAFGFGPFVRYKARGAAARYGAEVDIDWVVPTLAGVSLRGVTVRHPDAPSMHVELDDILVSWGSSPRRVKIAGGRVTAEGPLDQVIDEVERVRAKRPSEGEGGGSSTQIELSGLKIVYRGEGATVELDDVKFERGTDKLAITAEIAKAEQALGHANATGLRVEIAKANGESKLTMVKTKTLEVGVDGALLGGSAAAATTDPAPATTTTLKDTISKRVAQVRAGFVRASRLFDAYFAKNGIIELSQLRADVVRSGEKLGVGPGMLRVQRPDGGALTAEYVAGFGEPDALTVKLANPEPTEPFVVEVRGGPITLAALGIHEGDLGLVDVDRAIVKSNAKVSVDVQTEVLSFDGDAEVNGLSALVPALAKDPIKKLRLSFRGSIRAALDGSQMAVKDGDLEIGGVRLHGAFDVAVQHPPGAKKPDVKFDGSLDMPLVPCQSLLDAAPEGLLPTIAGMRLAGSISIKGSMKFDTPKLDKTFDAKWDIASTCRVTEVPPSIDVARFKKAFSHVVYGATGEPTTEVETGPGTAAWASYRSISRFMETGVVSFEDGRFFRHEGFDQEAIRNSIRENLRTWTFVRGASTISMQLAKNLYLSRDKRLGRKLEEAFLTMYLEQNLTKEQILELYLNVVEFGPNVYGIRDASRFYFHTSPSSLSLSQAFFLASILPTPKKEFFVAGGSLSRGRLGLLRTVMKHANKVHRITDEELAQGLTEIPVRGSSSPMKDPDAPEPPSPTDDQPKDPAAVGGGQIEVHDTVGGPGDP